MIITNTRLTDDTVSFFPPKSNLPYVVKQLLVKAADIKSQRMTRRKVFVN